jgi:hypothetical protein
LFVSLELSRFDMGCSVDGVRQQKDMQAQALGGDGRELPDFLPLLKTRVEQRIAAPVKLAAIHEVGLDGFWAIRQRRKCARTAG